MKKIKCLKRLLKAVSQKVVRAKLIVGLLSTATLAMMMDVAVFADPNVTTFEGKEYYEISSAEDLYWFLGQVNNRRREEINAVLTKDIIVNEGRIEEFSGRTGVRIWTPIGYYCNFINHVSYRGIFNGQGYTISGLFFNDPEKEGVGLFGVVYRPGVLKNIVIKNSYFRGKCDVGGVVGRNGGTIENCKNEGSVNGIDDSVGGIVGANCREGIIENCSNKGLVSTERNAGGVSGWSEGAVKNCRNEGTIVGNDCYVGGVVGFNQGTVESCKNLGKVSGRAYVGGIVGENWGTVESCRNENIISGKDPVGGIVGRNFSEVNPKVERCTSIEGCAKQDIGEEKCEVL